MKPLGEGEGEFSELVLLAIEVNDGAKGAAPRLARHLVAKFSPPDLSAVELAQVFGTEAHFYNDTSVEAGGLNRPEALYVGYCKGSGCCGKRQYCIIMESAAGTREAPTVCYKRVDGCNSPHHMRLAMRSLARFHARWWQHPQASVLKHYSHPFTAGGPLPKFPSCIAITAWMLMFKNGLKALPHCFSTHPKYDGVPKFAFEYAQFIMELRPVLRRRRLAAVREPYEEALAVAGTPIATFFTAHSVIVPIAKSEVSYLRPLACGDKVRIEVTPRRLSDHGFALDFTLWKQAAEGSAAGEKRAAVARTEHVCISATQRERQPLPAALAAWVDAG
jgi:1,4-dihydroxy-2-naphthoyl-CoA hydrolase